MLRKLIQAAISISIVLSLLAIAMILVGHDQSEPQLFKVLHLCDGMPCYLEVAPGKTTWDSALTIYEDAPGMAFDPNTNIAANPPGYNGSNILLDVEQGSPIVGGIVLDIRSTDVSVGSLVLQFGSPCSVNVDELPNTQILMYDSGMEVLVFTSDLDAGFLKPTTPVFKINLFGNLTSCSPLSSIYRSQRWKGFVRYTN